MGDEGGQELLLPRGRTLPINGDAVRTLRIKKPLSLEQLASLSKLSVDRLMEIEKGGQKVYQSTFMAIAQALGLVGNDWKRLQQAAIEPVTQAKPPEALPRTGTQQVTLIFSNDATISTSTPNEDIATLIRTFLDLKYDVTITAVKKGSVIVELELSEEDLLRLVAAFCETRLDAIHVDAIRLPATTGPLAAGLLQIIQPPGTPVGEMTDPVMPEMTLTRTAAKSLPFAVEEAKSEFRTAPIWSRLTEVFKRRPLLFFMTLLLLLVSSIAGLLIAKHEKDKRREAEMELQREIMLKEQLEIQHEETQRESDIFRDALIRDALKDAPRKKTGEQNTQQNKR